MDNIIAFMGSQAIRSDFEDTKISMLDVFELLPFQHTIDLITMKGKHLREILMDSASRLTSEGKKTKSGFLQVSGLIL